LGFPCVYLRMYVRAYLATLAPYGDNNKIYVCRAMISIYNLNIKHVFDKKINKMK